jgi:hypothetical protein
LKNYEKFKIIPLPPILPRTVLANKLRSLSERVGGYTVHEYIIFRVPSSQIFHKTDWDIQAFENAATAIVKRVGGILVSSSQKGGKWEILWEMPIDPSISVQTNKVIDKIENLPEYRIPKQYGAKVTVE